MARIAVEESLGGKWNPIMAWESLYAVTSLPSCQISFVMIALNATLLILALGFSGKAFAAPYPVLNGTSSTVSCSQYFRHFPFLHLSC